MCDLEHADGGVDFGNEARLCRQMKLLASFSPSVVALQECKDWDRDHYSNFHLAEDLLGMRGFLSLSPHHGCHLALFVRPGAGLRVTQQRHERGHPYWHGAARIVAEEPDGHLLQLASVHLAPSSSAIRIAEAEALGLIAKEFPAIIAGDFNALPATDPEPHCAGSRSHRKLNREPAVALEEAGFLDVGAHAEDLTPTVGHDSDLPYRCDRIYTTLPAAAITGYQVITNADSESDHRPVIAEFDFSPEPDHADRAGVRP